VRLAILGGTFDPVHNAHLAMARAALDHLELDRILWIPTGRPNYRQGAIASAEDRLAMLKLALAGEPRYRIDERELAPGATGYTVDALKGFRDKLYFLMGADQYEKFGSWRDPEEIRKLAEVVVFARPGNTVKGGKTIPFEPMNISGTGIRSRAKRGEDLSGMVPAAVAEYIVRHRLYR